MLKMKFLEALVYSNNPKIKCINIVLGDEYSDNRRFFVLRLGYNK